MSGPKRNPDRLNTIGIVVVGICGAVLVYVSIVALQAFYLGDTSEIQTMADYGGQDSTFKSVRSAQITAINESKPNAPGKDGKQTYQIPIAHAMKLVLRDVKTDPSNLVPMVGPANQPSLDVPPVGPDGRLPRVKPPAPAAGSADAGSAAGSAAPAAGSAAGSAAPEAGAAGSAAPQTPTAGQGPGGGSAGAPGAAPNTETQKADGR